jgi:hypothetical protein
MPTFLAPLNKLFSDVHRAALLNIPVMARTIPAVLTRTHDIDMTVRRLVYGSVLLMHAELPDDAMPGAAHPCALTIVTSLICSSCAGRTHWHVCAGPLVVLVCSYNAVVPI